MSCGRCGRFGHEHHYLNKAAYAVLMAGAYACAGAYCLVIVSTRYLRRAMGLFKRGNTVIITLLMRP